MFVSVVIPTKDRPEAVADAVRSVFAGSHAQFEVIVVDQSRDCATRDRLLAEFRDPRLHYRVHRRPGLGAAHARNVGLALSVGDVIACLDDDVTARPDWMARVVTEFEGDSQLEFLCGKLTAPLYDRAAGYTPEFDPGHLGKARANWRMPLKAAGANFSLRRSLLGRIGGYDDSCSPGASLKAHDDLDIAFRVVRSGARWKGCPHVEVVHTHGFRPAGRGTALKREYEYGSGANFGRFLRGGDWRAGVCYLLWEALQASRALAARSGEDLRVVFVRLAGFRHGLCHPAAPGVLLLPDLVRLRDELLGEVRCQTPEFPIRP